MPDSQHSVAGVRFRNAGKIFYFHAAGMRLDVGEYVIVETVRGPEVARVVIAPDQVVINELGREELKPILRLATDSDIRRMDQLKQQAEEIIPEARRLGEEMRFPAHLDAAEFTLDGRRLTLSFTSEERLDYRDFVRRASDRFKLKVDMRQMGARDRAKLAGGYGICGRELCCSNWLTTFPSISIRMAKEQDLPLNPQKISGLCGRLLCCLSYEEEGYKEMRKTLPKLGQRCSTPTGEGKVISLNILRRQVTLVVEGQRVEVGDRDLGLVVRWDTASKSGDPPPSISRVDAIAQGLIEETEDDRLVAAGLADGDDWLSTGVGVAPGAGRGRLPGGGPRKEIRSRPQPEASTSTPQRPPSESRSRGRRARTPDPNEQSRPERPPREGPDRGPSRPAGPAEGRIFQRATPPPSEPPPASMAGAESTAEPPAAGASRTRRGRRGRGGRGNSPQPPPG
jgi:cell fate regulator YaaT (PSP1 superfamily)